MFSTYLTSQLLRIQIYHQYAKMDQTLISNLFSNSICMTETLDLEFYLLLITVFALAWSTTITSGVVTKPAETGKYNCNMYTG